MSKVRDNLLIPRNMLGKVALAAVGEGLRIKYLREFEHSQYFSRENIEALQWERAKSMLEYAYANCPFYRQWLQRGDILPSDITSLRHWQSLPVLDKVDIQRSGDGMLARRWPCDDLIQNQTGGSTGEPIRFFLHKERSESRCAATMRHDGWAGVRIGDRVAYVWGAPRDVPKRSWRTQCRHLIIGRELWLDLAHITEEKLLDFIQELNRFKPRSIVAYANGIVLLANFILSRKISAFRPHSIITSAELLLPNDRTRVEQAFGCPVFNRYGCREVAVIASECAQHDGMHIMAEGLLVEIDAADSDSESGGNGAVLVTDLLNKAMPLIRYRIGDLASWAAGDCACGRGLPRLKNIAGRVTDFVIGADGRLVSGVFLATYVVAKRPSLGQVQIVQHAKGHIVYRVRPAAHYEPVKDDEYLRQSTLEYLGPGSTTEIKLVDRLTLEPSGKLLFCKSSVSPDFMDA